jgi:hypothetical protein
LTIIQADDRLHSCESIETLTTHEAVSGAILFFLFLATSTRPKIIF